jgi:hypothetical protein
MSVLRRYATPIILGLGLLGLAQQGLMSWLNRPAPAPVVPPVHLAGSACLPEAQVLAALAARGVQAVPETPDFCAEPAGLVHWYALTPVGPDGTHLAFDAAGCLRPWTACEGGE